MKGTAIEEQLLGVPDGHNAYATSLLFRRIVDTVHASERQGIDGVEALGCILITLSRLRDAETAEAVALAMRTVKPMIFCSGCGERFQQ